MMKKKLIKLSYLALLFVSILYCAIIGKRLWWLPSLIFLGGTLIFINYKRDDFKRFSSLSLIMFIFITVAEVATKRLSGWYFHEIPVEIISLVSDTNATEIKSSLIFAKKELAGVVLIFLNFIYLFFKKPNITYSNRTLVILGYVVVFLFLIFPKNSIYVSAKEIYQVKDIIKENSEAIQKRKSFHWQAESQQTEKQTIVLFLGETHRGDYLSINGYERETTPRLKERNVISFSDAISQAFATLPSTPMILSRKQVSDRGIFKEKSLISAYKEAGFETWYISYLSPSHIGDNEINLLANEADHYIRAGVSTDLLESILENSSDKKLIVYKTIGSHWLFHDRYPEEYRVFQPSFTKATYAAPTINDKEKLENDYANSILYSLDAHVSDFIDILDEQEGLVNLSFISDHGISIYDDGVTLYGGNTKGNFSIGLFFWFNDKYHQMNPKRIKELSANKHTPVTAECFVDTMLDIAEIKSIRKGCSLFNYSEIPKKRFVRDMQWNIYDFDKDL